LKPLHQAPAARAALAIAVLLAVAAAIGAVIRLSLPRVSRAI
jgi:hypothetical protein